MIARCSYHKSSDKSAPALRVPVPETHVPVLQAVRAFYLALNHGGYAPSEDTLAGEFFTIAAANWFESVAKMRIGDYLDRLRAGERFEWREIDGAMRLVSASSVSIQ